MPSLVLKKKRGCLFGQPRFQKVLMLVAFAFKGGTNGIPTAACGAGTYADPLGGAVALAVVVDAVLYTAGDAVDMLGDALVVISVFHALHSFPFRKR